VSEIFALLLAGLGLFFTGVDSVRSKLQQLSSRRFRLVLSRLTHHPLLASAAGAGFGALTQSAAAVAFILAGMVSTGMLPLRRALPVVAAANLGTAVLVFLAAVDLRLAVLYLVGVTGLLISFRVMARHDALLGALFGIGLLFFGLDLMKRAVGPLPSYDWFQALVAFLSEWTLAPFVLGVACRMVIQSSSTIGVIAIALQHAGLFSAQQAMLLICGAGPGAGLSVLFLSANLRGAPRQVLLYLGLINAIGGALAAALLLIDRAGPGWLIAWQPAQADAAGLLAWVYLATAVLMLLSGLALLPIAEPLLNRWAPPTVEQDLSRPLYLHDGALSVPDTALDLAEKEQLRLFSVIVQVIDAVRSESGGGSPPLDTLVRAGRDLAATVDAFLNDLVDTGLSGDCASRLLLLDRRQDHLEALLGATGDLATTAASSNFSAERAALVDRLKESLNFIFLSAQDAWTSRDADDMALLLALTADRGDMMERLRRHATTGSADNIEMSTVSLVTSLFERAVWLVRQIGLTLA
jgi:phosphate:Na+ symporter